MVNFGKAFTYIFDDERWFDKLIIPLLVSLIPVVGQFAMLGYILHTIDNVVKNELNPLPTFDFGQDLSRGFRYTLISLVYSLPIFVISLLMGLFSRLLNDNSGAGSFFGFILIGLLGLIMLVYILFLLLAQPIAMANFAVKNTFASGFEFGNFYNRLRKNFKAWLMVFGGQILTSLIAPIGILALFVGVLITGFYGQLFIAYLTGQAMIASE